MTLDPRERKSWAGFLDLLQPPPGYRLVAGLGTSFGVSIDALTAALIALCDADADAMADDPVASVMAITRLHSRMRLLVHPGTISGAAKGTGANVVAMLDRLVLQVDPGRGLFHPKVWALQFERCDGSRQSDPIGRIVVSSRNLAVSTCFEMGAFFEGVPASQDRVSPLAMDVAEALKSWLGSARGYVPPAVARLPEFVKRLELKDVPAEAADGLRFRWQGGGRRPLATLLPSRVDRAVLVSPFIQPTFIKELLSRVRRLHVLSTAAALDGLDDDTFAALVQLGAAQRSPVLYQVTEVGEPDGLIINDIHAKLLIIEDDAQRVSYLGSANATPPGWGLGGFANVEAMVEMRPGISIDRFMTTFVRQDKTKVHPWIEEYDRAAMSDHSEQEAERQLLSALRQMASVDIRIAYDPGARLLTVSRRVPRPTRLQAAHSDVVFDFAPLLLADRGDAWTPLRNLDSGTCRFTDVPLEKLTAFIALRARLKHPAMERTRLVLGALAVSQTELDQRDATVRDQIMAVANPVAVLNALVNGLAACIPSGRSQNKHALGGAIGWRSVLQEGGLERLLQSVASMPDLVTEMRLLLRRQGGEPFERFCDDLEAALAAARNEIRL